MLSIGAVKHEELIALARRQHRCVSLEQLRALGFGDEAVDHCVAQRWLVRLHDGVFAVGPVEDHDIWTRWMGATLTAPSTYLSHAAAGHAYGFWRRRPTVPTVVRRGDGGPKLHDGVMIFRSRVLDGYTTEHRGIPIVTPERAVLDLAPAVPPRGVARLVRESIRLRATTAADLLDVTRRNPGRRGVRRLYVATSRYAGLPLNRTRSDAEALAQGLLKEWGVSGWLGNEIVAGEEADLYFPEYHLIIEIDGPQYHLDVVEDARKQAIWEAAGNEVRRLPSDDVYLRPERLRALLPTPNVRGGGL